MKLENLEPKKIFRYFEEISMIPRESHSEDKIREYIIEFAKKNNLEYLVEEVGNVIIKKRATKGYENYKTIVLQVHMDMVCVKKEGYEHDFLNDSLDIVVEDGFIKANNTSLGADDGIGMAIVLSILENNELEHSNLSVLFTVEEETTMNGAMYTEVKNLQFDNEEIGAVINVDSENEGTLCVGSAGSISVILDKDIKWISNPLSDKFAYMIHLKDLIGGHSGIDINKNTANAIKLIARFLGELSGVLYIYHIDAGEKQNAIPNYAKVKIVSELNKNELEKEVNRILNIFKSEYPITEPNIKIDIIEEKMPEMVFSYDTFDEILAMLLIIQTGVISMDQYQPNLVETSNNLAIVRSTFEKIRIENCMRSMIESKLNEISSVIRIMGDVLNFKHKLSDKLPAWSYVPNTKLESIMQQEYNKLFGKNMKIEALHAGIESACFVNKLPNAELISIGPDVINPHTCYERIKIDSCGKVLSLLENVLKELKYEK